MLKFRPKVGLLALALRNSLTVVGVWAINRRACCSSAAKMEEFSRKSTWDNGNAKSERNASPPPFEIAIVVDSKDSESNRSVCAWLLLLAFLWFWYQSRVQLYRTKKNLMSHSFPRKIAIFGAGKLPFPHTCAMGLVDRFHWDEGPVTLWHCEWWCRSWEGTLWGNCSQLCRMQAS